MQNEMTEPPFDEEQVRLTAYFLWEQDGRPGGREAEYWQRALEQHRRQREFDKLIAQNQPKDGPEDG